MKERAAVWSARVVLLLSGLVGTFLVFTLVLSFPVSHSHHFWPFGHVHTVGEAIFAVLAEIVGCIIGLALAFILFNELYMGFKTLWCVAWRKSHVPWLKRWEAWDGGYYSGPKVTYDKPEPLVKGRIGSR